MPGLKRQAAREEGFTLLEIMMVVAIMGILTTMAVVQLQTTRNMLKGDSAMRLVKAQMITARETAITQRRFIRIVFDTTANTITLVREDTTTTTTSLGTVMFEGGAKIQLTAGTGDTPVAYGNTSATSFTSSSGTFNSLTGQTTVAKFAPDGTLVDWNGNLTNGTVFTAIPNMGPSARAVTILGATGSVTAYRWDGMHWQQV